MKNSLLDTNPYQVSLTIRFDVDCNTETNYGAVAWSERTSIAFSRANIALEQ